MERKKPWRRGVQAASPIKYSIKMIIALLFMLAYNTTDFDVLDQRYNDEVAADVHRSSIKIKLSIARPLFHPNSDLRGISIH